MAKLKKAPGRIIGRWKQEAIAANAGASDEDLAKIINEMARKQGYAYTITPEKVRSTTKKPARRRRAATKPAPAAAAARDTQPAARKAEAAGGISLDDIRSVKELVDRLGGERLQELAGMLGR